MLALTAGAVAAQRRGQGHSWEQCILRSISMAASALFISACHVAFHELLWAKGLDSDHET